MEPTNLPIQHVIDLQQNVVFQNTGLCHTSIPEHEIKKQL